MLSNVNCHLIFDLVDTNKKQCKYIFTVSVDDCSVCLNESTKYVIVQGSDTFKVPWSRICIDHIATISVKKQHCNICNKKSKIINNTPQLCEDCYRHLYENNIELMKTCKFPTISMVDCNCKFCNLR